jgi:MOSC domain-containing protein YiiM
MAPSGKFTGRRKHSQIFGEAGRIIQYGEFAENITTEGVLLHECRPLDRFIGNHVELEVTQIGKNAMAIIAPFSRGW